MGLHRGPEVSHGLLCPRVRGREPFTQKAHRYQDLRCGTLKSPL